MILLVSPEGSQSKNLVAINLNLTNFLDPCGLGFKVATVVFDDLG